MRELLFFLAIAALGNVVYHVAQKAMPQGANPMIVLMGVYAVAFLLSAVASPFFRASEAVPWTAQVLAWPVLVLGAGVLLIEIGFLLAYRTGGQILQWSGVAVNAAAAVMLLPVAAVAFRESFSIARGIGIVLALAGMTLMAAR
jgi:hypothetical protein